MSTEREDDEKRIGFHAWVQPAFGAGSALLGALIGGLFTFLATRATVESSLQQQERTFDEQAEAATRDQRVSTYRTFLDAANAYATATADLVDALQDCPGPEPEVCSVEADVFDSIESTRFDFQTALNDVYVYGSDTAVQLSTEIAASLPPSLRRPLQTEKSLRLDADAFVTDYHRFLAMMCQEAPAAPREGCV